MLAAVNIKRTVNLEQSLIAVEQQGIKAGQWHILLETRGVLLNDLICISDLVVLRSLALRKLMGCEQSHQLLFHAFVQDLSNIRRVLPRFRVYRANLETIPRASNPRGVAPRWDTLGISNNVQQHSRVFGGLCQGPWPVCKAGNGHNSRKRYNGASGFDRVEGRPTRRQHQGPKSVGANANRSKAGCNCNRRAARRSTGVLKGRKE